MTDRELMQQALAALKLIDDAMPFPVAKLAIKNLSERLAQPEQEHVIDCPRCGHCCPQPEQEWHEHIDPDSRTISEWPGRTISVRTEQEPVAWLVYTLDGKSVCVTDDPTAFSEAHRTLPLYTTPQPEQEPTAQSNLPDWIKYDPHSAVLTIHGKRYSADLFGENGFLAPAGTVLRIASGPDDVVTAFSLATQEPAAWIEHGLIEAPDELVWERDSVGRYTPLYTAPQPRQWQGLTDEERRDIREWQRIQEELGPVWAPMMLYLYEAIEAKLREKNA